MKKGIVFLSILLIVSIWTNTVKAEFVQRISVSNGLSHNGITSFCQDSKGFIWIGTYDGLNRYDGFNISVYKNTTEEEPLISSRVRAITEDLKGNIWIGTEEGISIYDYEKEKFENLYSNNLIGKGNVGPVIRSISVNKQKHKVICTTEKEGVLVFNEDYSFYKQFIPSKNITNKEVVFNDIAIIDEDHYVFATNVGVLLLNIESGKFYHVLKESVGACYSLSAFGKSDLFVATNWGISLIRYTETDEEYSFRLLKKLLKNKRIRAIAFDANNKLWLGVNNVGVIYIKNVNAFRKGIAVKQENYSLNNDKVRFSHVASTQKQGIWFGTLNNGIFRFDVYENPFEFCNAEMRQDYGITSNSIVGFEPHNDSCAFVIAAQGGVALFNTQSKVFEPLPYNVEHNLNRRIIAFKKDLKGNIWASYNRIGLTRVKAEEKRVEVIETKDFPLLKNFYCKQIGEDREGNIWLSSYNDILKLELDSMGDIGSISSLNDHPLFRSINLESIICMYPDTKEDFLWLGTKNEGLFRINIGQDVSLQECEIDHYTRDKKNKQSISSNFVSSIKRDHNGKLWVGTERGGICMVNSSSKDPEFIAITEKDGLSNNVIRDFVFDKVNDVWVSSGIGLNKIYAQEGSICRYNRRDGLPFDDFWGSSCVLNNGVILLSGVDGFCYFNPQQVPTKTDFPNLVLEDLRVLNSKVLPGDTINGRVILTTRLNNTSAIELKHDENVFSIVAKSLHFSTPANYYLKYRLLPIDKNWIELNSWQRYITYSGLQPGKYNLQICVSNSLKNWSDIRELSVVVHPPFWKTIWAYIIYVALAISVTLIVLFFFLRMQKLNYNLRLEKMEKDNVKKINEAKLSFFSDISHEIRTPITLISGPITQLINKYKGNEDLNEKLNLIKRQSHKISQLVDQVHDFQKADANLLEMNYSVFCFNDFIEKLLDGFNYLAKHENKDLIVSSPSSRIFVAADKDKVEKIFNNLLNNAFKYTQAQDKIGLSFRTESNLLKVVVRDTGRGIAEEDIVNVFDRFYQSKSKHSIYSGGSGIGLAFSKRLVDMHKGTIRVESKMNEGAMFEVILPVVKHLSNEAEKQLLEEEEKVKETHLITGSEEFVVEGKFPDAVIYLAEDNIEMRTYIADTLSKYFKVTTFENGQKCLDAMDQEWPDIVVSDILMPELNGLDLCKSIKSDIKTSHIPVILLTACIAEDDRIEGIRVGADAYIKKPFSMNHLVTRIESLLHSRQVLRERFLLDIPLTLESREKSNTDHEFLEKLYDLFLKNLNNQDLDLDHIARELFLSRSIFYKKVKAVTNCTPFELLKNYRIKKAAEFLVQKNMNVNEAFMATGFKSRTHFTKTFKEVYEVSPGAYASQAKKKLEN